METGIQNNILKELVNFVPGGTFLGTFRPFVTMSKNMLWYPPESIASGYAPKRLPFVTEPLREVQQPALIIPSAY